MPSKIGRAPALATCILCGAICGTVLPAPTHALAQSDTGLFFEAPAVLSPAQPSITVRLWAEFPAADYAFAYAALDVRASEPAWSDPELVLLGPGADPGLVAGPDVVGVLVGQVHWPTAALFADPTNPIEVWAARFTITDFTPRTISLSTDTSQFGVYPDISAAYSVERASHEAFHEIRVIPAPGALGLGGVGVLSCALRRRRRAHIACAAGALTAFAGGASAQPDNGFILEAPVEVGPGSGRFEVRLLAEFDGRAYDSFAGARLDVHASEAGWSDPELILMGIGTTPGEITGQDVTGLIVGQDPYFIYPDPTNPIAVWKATFTISDFSPRTLRIETATSVFAVYVDPDPPWPTARPPFHEGMIEIRVIPAPGALGLGGVGVLACVVRRRNRRPR